MTAVGLDRGWNDGSFPPQVAVAMISIVQLSGGAILPHLNALAALRIKVFREFPYLYDGSEAYERDYLADYADCPQAVAVLAMQGDRVVGASTGMPLVAADAAFRAPFEKAGVDPATVFYFGESVLEPEFRGQGIGNRFFDAREAHAAGLGFHTAAFCSVIREEDHPLRPAEYRPLDAFWIKRGYTRHGQWVAELEWKQVDGAQEQRNRLVFWTRAL
jgi:GNAT superfamily N-acetyltransferase